MLGVGGVRQRRGDVGSLMIESSWETSGGKRSQNEFEDFQPGSL